MTVVWRVVYDLAGLTMRSDWSIHHEMINEYASEFARDMPGSNVRVERARVENVEVIGTKSVQTTPEEVEEESDIPAPYDVDPDYTGRMDE